MKKPEVIVETISSILPSGEKSILEAKPSASLVTMKLHRGRSVQLDISMPNAKTWAGILESMQRAKQPVYLKIDSKTGLITDLLIPRAVKVATLKTANRKGDVAVELVISEMRHYLRRSNPNFKSLLSILENALSTETPVLVTDSRDRHEIVDVRPIPKTVAVPGYLSAPLARLMPPEALRAASKKKASRAEKGGPK